MRNINFNEEDYQKLTEMLRPKGVSVSWMVRYLVKEELKKNQEPTIKIIGNSVVLKDRAGKKRTLVAKENKI